MTNKIIKIHKNLPKQNEKYENLQNTEKRKGRETGIYPMKIKQVWRRGGRRGVDTKNPEWNFTWQAKKKKFSISIFQLKS